METKEKKDKCSLLYPVLLLATIFAYGAADIVRIGPDILPIVATIDSSAGSTFLVNDVVLGHGVLFAFSAFFVNTSRVQFQVWRPYETNNTGEGATFQLVFQAAMTPSVSLSREDSIEDRQIEEVVCGIFHSLFLERAPGKFHYKQEGSYSIGSIGMVDVDCDFVNFTYMRVPSDELDRQLKRVATEFREELHREGSCSGQITLEFFHKKRTQWPFLPECIPWEVWILKIDTVVLANEHERQQYREKVGELLAEKMFYITDAMSRHEYVPKFPSQSELDLVFDTSFPDIQPYLFKITYRTNMMTSASVGTTMRRFIRDTLAF